MSLASFMHCQHYLPEDTQPSGLQSPRHPTTVPSSERRRASRADGPPQQPSGPGPGQVQPATTQNNLARSASHPLTPWSAVGASSPRHQPTGRSARRVYRRDRCGGKLESVGEPGSTGPCSDIICSDKLYVVIICNYICKLYVVISYVHTYTLDS